jgi:hypothetical protein
VLMSADEQADAPSTEEQRRAGTSARIFLDAWAGQRQRSDASSGRGDAIFKAQPASQPDFAGMDLSSLDLSGLDFKQARLTGANLLGADLTDANLSKADLRGAMLDRTRLARANFSSANLAGASFYHAVGTVDFEAHSTNAPNFSGANLSGARIMARLSRADLRGANLADEGKDVPVVARAPREPEIGCAADACRAPR